MRLILASASPRRAEILRNAGFPFIVSPTHVIEARLHTEPAERYVGRLAEEKAKAALARLGRGDTPAIIIGADTVVVTGSDVLGKPSDIQDARRMLQLLRGGIHEVMTGLSLISAPSGRSISHVEMTKVTFADISDLEIDSYLASREPFDKAGAYGIQGIGGRYVSRIEGCYFNVIGLPLSRFWSMLKTLEGGEIGLRDQAKEKQSGLITPPDNKPAPK